MSQQRQQGPQAISDAVNGFDQLEARQVTIHEWRVLSYRNGTLTAQQVNIETLDCTCLDLEYNQRGPEICDHIAVALHHATRKMEVGDAISHELHQQMLELDEVAQSLARRASGLEGESTGADAESTESADNGSQDGFSGDPTEAFRSLLLDAGLDPAAFDFWVDRERGSLQVDQDGYLEEGDFDTWVDFSDRLDLGYDGDNDVNYLTADRFPEVFG